MSTARDYHVEQEEEIEILRSIFVDELEILPKVWGQNSFLLKLRHIGRDESSIGAEAAINLTVVFPKRYPDEPPILKFSQSLGITTDAEKKLKDTAHELAKTLVGDPMIFNIATAINEFLQNHAQTQKSMHARMEERRREAEQIAEHATQATDSLAKQEEDAAAQAVRDRVAAEVARRTAAAQKAAVVSQEQTAQSAFVPGVRSPVLTASVPSKTRGPVVPPSLQLDAPNPGPSQDTKHPPNPKLPHVTFPNHANITQSSHATTIDDPLMRDRVNEQSRYANDFEEVCRLGEGGFGKVLKVRNRLDGMFYAVKVIKLEKNPAANRKLLREVTTLSRLQHRFIVRYFQAWLESNDATREGEIRRRMKLEKYGTASISSSDCSDDEEWSESQTAVVQKEDHTTQKYDSPAQVTDADGVMLDVSRSAGQESTAPPLRLFLPGTPTEQPAPETEDDWMAIETSQSELGIGQRARAIRRSRERRASRQMSDTSNGLNVTKPRIANGVIFESDSDSETEQTTSDDSDESSSDSSDSSDDSSNQYSPESETPHTSIHRVSKFWGGNVSDSSSTSGDNTDSTSENDTDSDSDDDSEDISQENKNKFIDHSSSASSDIFITQPTKFHESSQSSLFSHQESSNTEIDIQQSEPKKKPKDVSQRTTVSTPRQYLYIQMEYCPGATLREVIDANHLHEDIETVWRLFRQVLEALSYLQKRGLIHRDLKPPNLFIDAEGSIKLGDFGLATDDKEEIHDVSTIEQVKKHQDSSASASATDTTEGVTMGVGTTLYRAPELDPSQLSNGKDTPQKGHNAYDIKADMFSLGIVLYEMCRPAFETRVERFHTLMQLRRLPKLNDEQLKKVLTASSQSKSKSTLHDDLPPELAKLFERIPRQAVTIIRWLLAPTPEDRPSADKLLNSPLLPLRGEIEQAYLDEALRAVSHPGSRAHTRLLQELLSKPTLDTVDFTFDLNTKGHDLLAGKDTAGGKSHPNMPCDFDYRALLQREALRRQLVGIFSTHGAIPFAAPLLAPQPADMSALASASLQRNAGIFSDPMNVAMLALSRRIDLGEIYGASAEDVAFALESYRGMAFGGNMGGVAACSPVLAPTVACLLDTAGTLVYLPYDLCEPLARYVARHGIENVKRYTISRVYRSSSLGGGSQPREIAEADYDIIWGVRSQQQQDENKLHQSDTNLQRGSSSGLRAVIPGIDTNNITLRAAAAEADVMSVTAEVMFAISAFVGPYFVRLNNAKIIRGLMDFCCIPIAKRNEVAKILSAAAHSAYIQGATTKRVDVDTTIRAGAVGRRGKHKAATKNRLGLDTDKSNVASGTNNTNNNDIPTSTNYGHDISSNQNENLILQNTVGDWPKLRRHLCDKVGLSQASADALKRFIALPPDPLLALEELEQFAIDQWTILHERLISASNSGSRRSKRSGATSLQLRLRLAGLAMLADGVYELQHTIRRTAQILIGTVGLDQDIMHQSSQNSTQTTETQTSMINNGQDVSSVNTTGQTSGTLFSPSKQYNSSSGTKANTTSGVSTNMQSMNKQLIHLTEILNQVNADMTKSATSQGNNAHNFGPLATALVQFLSAMRFDCGFTDRSGKYGHAFVFQVVLDVPDKVKLRSKKHNRSVQSDTVKGDTQRDQHRADMAAVGLRVPVGTDRDCIAKGGRYDDLVLRFKVPGDGLAVPVAVGVRVALDKINTTVAAVLARRRAKHKQVHSHSHTQQLLADRMASASDVLVCSVGRSGEDLFSERLTISARLWDTGIRSEYWHPSPSSYDALVEYCEHQSIPIMVIVKESALRENSTVRIRTVDGTHEKEVDLISLPTHVSGLLSTVAAQAAKWQAHQQASRMSFISQEKDQLLDTRRNSGLFKQGLNSEKHLSGTATTSLTSFPFDPTVMDITYTEDCTSMDKNVSTQFFNKLSTFVPPAYLLEPERIAVVLTRISSIAIREAISAFLYSMHNRSNTPVDVGSAMASLSLDRLPQGAKKGTRILLRNLLDLVVDRKRKGVHTQYIVVYSCSDQRAEYATL